jgi:hypothetical protein
MTTSGFHHVHGELAHITAEIRLAARMVPTLSAPERERVRRNLVELLHAEADGHTRIDDDLHPCLAYDHVAIRDWIHQVQICNVDEASYLQELLYGLDALIRVHLWREEELFAPPDRTAALIGPGW